MMKRRGGHRCSTEIGKLIQRNDYTMQDIADKIGVHVSTVKNYVRGKTRVTNNVIIDVAEILNNDPENDVNHLPMNRVYNFTGIKLKKNDNFEYIQREWQQNFVPAPNCRFKRGN